MQVSIWRDRRFLMYALGGFVNNTGNGIYLVALPLMVFSLTGSVAAMSIMSICETVPRSLIGLFIAGPLVDRVSRRVVLTTALTFQSICSVGLALLYMTDHLQIWMLYVIGALIATALEFVRSANFAVVPLMFGDRKMEANSALNSMFRLSMILGPAFASLLLAVSSYSMILWINAFTYFGPLVALIWTNVPRENLGGVRTVRQIVVDLREGLRFIYLHKSLVRMLASSLFYSLATGGITTVMVYSMKHHYGMSDETISGYLTLSAAGALLSSLITPRFANVDKGKLMKSGLIIATVSIALLLIPVFWIVPVALVVSGVGQIFFTVAYTVAMQDETPNEMLGRIGSAMRMIEFLSRGLSSSLLGAITAKFGVEAAFVGAGLISVLPLVALAQGGLGKFLRPLPKEKKKGAY
ncbi:MAG: MFS transporter [Tumebacillaceae bacterium]